MQNNKKLAFYLCQELQDVSFQIDTTDTETERIANPMAINVQRIAHTREKLHFLYCSVHGVLYPLINILGPFSVIL